MGLLIHFDFQGQLGHEVVAGDMSLAPLMIPRHFFGGESVSMVSCGDAHTAATTMGGSLFVWGSGDRGQLGLNDSSNRRVPARIPPHFFASPTARRDSTSCDVEQGVGVQEERDVGEEEGVGRRERAAEVDGADETDGCMMFVACGDAHTVAVARCGALFSWGYGSLGQLGHANDTSNKMVCLHSHITHTEHTQDTHKWLISITLPIERGKWIFETTRYFITLRANPVQHP